VNKIILKKFRNNNEIFLKCIKILKKEIKNNNNIIISGGNTYLEFFKLLKENVFNCKINFYISDERILKTPKIKINLYNIKKSFLNLEKKVKFFFDIEKYNISNKLFLLKKIRKEFNKKKIKINLAFLGVGVDGHIASIFDNNIVNAVKEPFFLSKNKHEKFQRISFTFDYLKEVDQIIFVITGSDKKYLIENLKKNNYSKDIVFFNFLKKTNSEIKIFYAKKKNIN
jgi:6-phosphogluconolactonase